MDRHPVRLIPLIELSGRLSEGIYRASCDEFAARFGWNGVRKRQLHGLKCAALSLALARCTRLYVDDSNVPEQEETGDIDACWDEEGVEPQAIDSVLVDLSNKRAAQEAKYGGTIFPANLVTDSGLTILESHMIDYYTGQPKGIVVLNPQELAPSRSQDSN